MYTKNAKERERERERDAWNARERDRAEIQVITETVNPCLLAG